MYKHISRWLPYACLLLIGACMYWPVITGLFFLKNDAAVAYFPVRLQMSQAVHHGMIPFWSPYFNYGYPLHADFTSGFWNPVVWLCITLFHYSFYILHLEWMCYVWIAGWGMFRLCRLLGFSDLVACTVAIAYMGSGYWLGSAEWLNWLSPVAWLPHVLAECIRLFRSPRLTHALSLAIVLWCYISNAHPDQIIWLVYFGIISLLFIGLFSIKNRKSNFVYQVQTTYLIKYLWIACICTGLLLAGMILSIYTAIPYMYRSKALNPTSMDHPFNIACWVSFLFPLATTSSNSFWNQTDIALRNAYTGSLLWICAMGFFVQMRKFPAARFWFIQAICFLILSAGWLQHLSIWNHETGYFLFPLVHYVRLESAWRLGAVLAFCISGGYFLHIIERDVYYRKKLIKLLGILLIIYLVTLMISFSSFFHLFSLIKSLPAACRELTLKNWMSQLKLNDKLIIESITGLLLTGFLFIVLLKKISSQQVVKLVCLVIILDIFIHVQWMMPYLVVGNTRVKNIQQLVNVFPEHYPIPPLIPIQQYDSFPTPVSRMIGSKSYYDKRIGSADYPEFYPNLLSTVRLFYQSGYAPCANRTPYLYVSDKIYPIADLSKACRTIDSSAIFLEEPINTQRIDDADNIHASLTVHTCLPGVIRVSVFNTSSAMLLCKQNDYPYWKAFDDEKPVSIYRANISFMAIRLPAGNHHIEFRYDPFVIRIGFWLMWCTCACIMVILMILKIKHH